jgi:hypothetical protein
MVAAGADVPTGPAPFVVATYKFQIWNFTGNPLYGAELLGRH